MFTSFTGRFKFGRRAGGAGGEPGLILSLDAANGSSYQGFGNIWTNLVGGTNYTINAGTFDPSYGGSIIFNGSNSTVPVGIILSSGTNYTIEAWVYAFTTSGSRTIVGSNSNVLWISGGTLYGGLGGAFTEVSSSAFPINVWRQVVLSFNDTTNTMKLYINGSLVNQKTTVTNSYAGEVVRIGGHFWQGQPSSFFNGRIAKVKIYNREVTSTEILQNYDLVKSLYGL